VTRDRKQIRLTAAGTRLPAHARTIEREFRLARIPGARPGAARRAAAPGRAGVAARTGAGLWRRRCRAAAGPGRRRRCRPAAGWAKGNSTRSSRCFTARRMMAPWWRKLCHAAAPGSSAGGRTMVSALDLAGDV
jgi:hypothetical protein